MVAALASALVTDFQSALGVRVPLVSTTVLFKEQVQKDAHKLASASPALKQKALALPDQLATDP